MNQLNLLDTIQGIYRAKITNEQMKVLIACEYSGTVRDAFTLLGHEAWSCDLLPSDKPGNHFQGDLFDFIYERWDLIIAHPPCTYLANAGLHYCKDDLARQEKREQAANFFVKIWQAPAHKICIENPVGWMNTNWRKPTQIIQPYYFGDSELKTTCLWLRGLPKLQGLEEVARDVDRHRPAPLKTITRKTGSKAGMPYNYYWRQGKSAHDRARTFPGIASAMATQWTER